MGAIMTTTQPLAIWIMCMHCETPHQAYWAFGNVYAALCPAICVTRSYFAESALIVKADDTSFPGLDGEWYSASNEETGQWEAWDYDGTLLYGTPVVHWMTEDTFALCGAAIEGGTLVRRNVTCRACADLADSIYSA